MEHLIKRLSFFIIYIPTLCYGCQLFYYFGLFYQSEQMVLSLGLNTSEVTFFGANEVFFKVLDGLSVFFKWISSFLIVCFYLISFILLCPFFIWLCWCPKTFQRKTHRIKYIAYSLSNHWDFRDKKDTIFPKILSAYFIFVLVFFVLPPFYLSFYHQGEDDFHKALKVVEQQKQIIKETNEQTSPIETLKNIGIVKQGDQINYVYQLACGHYKCAGIFVEDLTLKSYLPENYTVKIKVKK